MPFLPITDEAGELSGDAVLIVLCVMAFPGESQDKTRTDFPLRFQEKVAGALEDHFAEQDEDDLVDEKLSSTELAEGIGYYFGGLIAPYGGFPALSQAPSFEEAREALYQSMWPGSIAGEMLLRVLEIRASGVRSPSINKAVFLMEDYLSGARTFEGKSVGGSARYIRRCWSDFRSDAHLWAVLRVWMFEGKEREDYSLPNPDSWCSPARPETLPNFLAFSERLLTLASGDEKSQPPLDRKLAWRCPENLDLPDVNVSIEGLDPLRAELLKRYKAPKSY